MPRIYIHCDDIYANDTEYIRFGCDLYDETYKNKFTIFSSHCRQCNAQLFDDQTSEMLLTIHKMGGMQSVKEYLRLIFET